MKVERQQIMSLYMKVMKRFHKYLSSIASKDTLPSVSRLKDVSETIRYFHVIKLLFLHFCFSLTSLFSDRIGAASRVFGRWSEWCSKESWGWWRFSHWFSSYFSFYKDCGLIGLNIMNSRILVPNKKITPNTQTLQSSCNYYMKSKFGKIKYDVDRHQT